MIDSVALQMGTYLLFCSSCDRWDLVEARLALKCLKVY